MNVARTATRDTTIAGVQIKAGDLLLVSTALACRDPEEFDHADAVDLDRSQNRHLAFGAGPHRCLGSHLARLELRTALEEFHAQIPDYRIPDGADIKIHGGGVLGHRPTPVGVGHLVKVASSVNDKGGASMTLRRSLVSVVCSIGLVGALVLAGGAAGASAPRAATNGTATVGVILDSTLAQVVAQGKAGVNAAVKALNKKGGANGAKIVAKFCDSGSDANTAAKCASDFADDAKVSALVGTQTNFGDTVDPVIEKANLPSIGQSMFGLSDFKSPMIFPADGGSLSGIAAAGPICLNDLKGKTMALGYIDSASGAQLIPVFDTLRAQAVRHQAPDVGADPDDRRRPVGAGGPVGERQSGLHRGRSGR